ncbi:MAG: galactose ABC transporter substrate-binding protein [Eubacteriales bacterium]|nr:galactose ABC transporter substrate-binding protein [Clostridiales bacterium]MDD6372319.1 galactose ABC transporter substrate-binding protein [Eubacteriales bacterium]MDD7259814.1 galactose ABC transporter substrate-binding protein [Eubacteriales bacterium]MDY6068050.1 galactose ABC transporter substrate-binding protein [Candidatus Faecousia sp.]
MKKFIALVLVLTMALSLAACGGSGSSSKKDGEVAVFWYTFGDTYLSSVRAALNTALTNAGVKYQDYDANGSQTTQTEQIQTAITKGASVLVVNIVDASSDDATQAIVDMAKNANTPLVFFNRSVSEEIVSAYDKAAYVGTDYTQAGHMQGEMIGNYLVANYDAIDLNGDGVISYVMFKGQEGNAEADARTQYGVEDADAVLTGAGKAQLSFYDANNTSKYLVDQNGAWSAAQGQDYMQTILAQYSEANSNMVELVIANNDDMALGAIAALQAAGYNNGTGKTIPVFGVDATDAAKEKIADGSMTGTIKQDAEGMANAISTITQNLASGKATFEGIDSANVVGTWRVNIPYSSYTGE